jgi:hypothetical protein
MKFRGIRNWLILLIAIGLGGVAACSRGTPAPRPTQATGTQAVAEADSIPVSGVGPEVASVFRLARSPGGVRTALDSLQALVDRDSVLGFRGHELAHALGRFAMGERKQLSMLRECTPIFQSGCFHGALEGYFLQGGTADAESVRQICPERPAPGQRGYEVLECWHGLGHGLMVHFKGDFSQAVPLCDRLQPETARRECTDGIFMERAIRAVGTPSINVGTGPAMGHGGHGGGHAHGAHGDSQPPAAPARLSNAELQQLCTAVDARYQPSCWAYQSVALFDVVGVDADAVLRACDQAPAAAVRDCYQGFGKQYLGALGGDVAEMIAGCQQGNRALAADCMLGGVEYFTDIEWTIEPGIEFCAQVPDDAKPKCYDLIGRRLALVHPEPRQAEAACRRVEAAFVPACLAGAAQRL